MRVIAFALLVAGSQWVGAVEFPQIQGKVFNETGLDLKDLSITVEAECNDPKTGDCGLAKLDVKWDAATSTYTLPAFKLGAALTKGDYFDGWGKRYAYSIHLRSKALSAKGFVWAHELDYFSWENRVGNSTGEMLEDLKFHLQAITLFAVNKATEVIVPFKPEHLNKQVRLRYQKQFLPATEGGSADVAKTWLIAQIETAPAEADKFAIAVPPMIFALRGTLDNFSAKPRSRALLFFYVTEEREGMKGLAYKGQYDDGEAPFNPDAHFRKAAPQIVLD